MSELPKIAPVPILLVNYNRLGFLKKAIEGIETRTLYPNYLFVIDNNSTDGSKEYLKQAKVRGKIFDCLFLPENLGQSNALNRGFAHMESWQEKRPMDDFVFTTNEDIYPPNLRPCWMEQMLDIFKRNEDDGLGALAMRIQRTPRAEIDESKDVIYWNKGVPSVFRLMRRSDLRQLGDRPFGRLLKWDSNSMGNKCKFFIKKRYGLATHIYADHFGWCENKGYDKETETLTVAANKKTEHSDKPYPEIDPDTNIPIEINHQYDGWEHQLRKEAKDKILSVTIKYKDKEQVIETGEAGSVNYSILEDIKSVLSSWKAKT